MRPTLSAFLVVLALLAPAHAFASSCYALTRGVPGVQYADLGPVKPIETPEVVIRFIGHSTFRIETPEGVVIATDFFGYWGGGEPPNIVTMNQAHETHYTNNPDPRIEHVLRGWNPSGEGPAKHELRVKDVLVRNVPTNIRGYGGPIAAGNSIFVFEVADLCIGHLGHLQHELAPETYALIGRLDVVMAPVDGTWTLGVEPMSRVLKQLKARVVLPMHIFSGTSYREFLSFMESDFAIQPVEGDTVTVSLTSLPRQPTVFVLPMR